MLFYDIMNISFFIETILLSILIAKIYKGLYIIIY